MTEFFLDVIAGPSAGGSLRIGPDQQRVIGRSRACDLPIDDELISAQHLIVSCGSGEAPTVTARDLRTTNGTKLLAPNGAAKMFRNEARVWDSDSLLLVGGHVLQVRPARVQPAKVRPAPASKTSNPVQVVQLSPPHPKPPLPPAQDAPPEAPREPTPRRIPWVAMVTSAAGGLVMAALFRMAFMLIFSILAPTGMLLQFLWEKRRTAKDHALEIAQHKARLKAHRAEGRARELEVLRITRAGAIDPAETRRQAAVPCVGLWQFWSQVPAEYELLLGLIKDGAAHVPLHVPLGSGAVGVFGPPEMVASVTRWIAVTLATSFSPSRARISAPWEWVAGLPHAGRIGGAGAGAAGAAGVGAGTASSGGVVFEFCDASRAAVTAPETGVQQIVFAAQRSALPAHCSTVVEVRPDFSGRCEVLPTHEVHEIETLCGVSVEMARAVAGELAPLRDEDSLPPTFRTLDEIWGEPSVERVAENWRLSATRPCALRAPLGENSSGELVELDLAVDGPHLLIGGTTGAGKSVLQRALIMSLALTQRPEHLALVLIDYKGGAAFRCLEALPHVIDTVTDLEEAATVRTLLSLRAELRRREHVLATHNFSDHDQLAAAGLIAQAPRLVIVVDELRALGDAHPDLLGELVQLAALGRSLGVHLVLATQRPGSIVNADMRANINARIALRVQSSADSQDILETPEAALLPADQPGSALMRFGSAPARRLQVAAITDTQAEELTDRVVAAAQSIGAQPPRQPWLPPLPQVLENEKLLASTSLLDQAVFDSGLLKPDALGATSSRVLAGMRDHAALLKQDALEVEVGRGHVLIAGGPSSGRTSALRALAHNSPAPVHVIARNPHEIVDEQAPWVGTRARIEDQRLIRRLVEELFSQGAHPRLVLVDDADWLLDPENGQSYAWSALQQLLRRGGEQQITVALAGGRMLLAPRVSELMSTRWILNWSDDTAITMGAVGRDTPIPAGPGGVAQVAHGQTTPARIAWVEKPRPGDWVEKPRPGAWDRPGSARRPQPDPAGHASRQTLTPPHAGAPIVRLLPLPDHVEHEALVRTTRPQDVGNGCEASSIINLGIGGDHAQIQRTDLTSLVIAGPPGSGRTNALNLISAQASAAWHDVIALQPERAVDQLKEASETAIVVVDDLDLALSWDPHARWVEMLMDRLRQGRIVIASAGTSGWANSYSGLMSQMRRARTGIILHAATRGSNEVFGLDVARWGDDGSAPVGRAVLVAGGEVTALQLARHDPSLHAKPRA